MCGVIGFWSELNPSDEAISLSLELIRQSRIRGLHSNGVTHISNGVKTTVKWLGGSKTSLIKAEIAKARVFIFHHRYSTSGDYSVPMNNQPIDIGSYSVVANSVLSMKPKAIYEKEFEVKCASSNDTEIFARILEQGRDAESFLKSVKGSFAGLYIKGDEVFAIRNRKRPLWSFTYGGNVWVVSTVDIARRAFMVLGLSGIELTNVPICKELNLKGM